MVLRADVAEERALARARMAVAKAEVGWGQGVELQAPARPVLAELLEEGALDRALLLLERDGESARILVAPRRHPGDVTVADLLEEDHRRLDALGAEMCQLAESAPARAFVAARMLDSGLRRHFRIEEDVLFPMYDERSGLEKTGPTTIMRREHEAMGVYLARVTDAAERLLGAEGRRDAAAALRSAHRGLADVLSEHNAKEERAVFPFLDKTSRARDREAMLRLIVLF